MRIILKMTLTKIDIGPTVKIAGFAPNWDIKYQTRLIELGFGVGQQVLCVRKTPLKGPIVFKTGDTLYSLGREVTDHILIEHSSR